MPKGRPRLTEDVLRQRIAAYCGRYEAGLSPGGLPVYPAGQRETPQHREWVVLYKASSRLEAHARLADPNERESLLRAQKGRCPVCAEPIDLAGVLDRDRATGRVRGLVHEACVKLVRLAQGAGPEAVGRLRPYLWPDTTGRR
jgi:hypothetical protein